MNAIALEKKYPRTRSCRQFNRSSTSATALTASRPRQGVLPQFAKLTCRRRQPYAVVNSLVYYDPHPPGPRDGAPNVVRQDVEQGHIAAAQHERVGLGPDLMSIRASAAPRPPLRPISATTSSGWIPNDPIFGTDEDARQSPPDRRSIIRTTLDPGLQGGPEGGGTPRCRQRHLAAARLSPGQRPAGNRRRWPWRKTPTANPATAPWNYTGATCPRREGRQRQPAARGRVASRSVPP